MFGSDPLHQLDTVGAGQHVVDDQRVEGLGTEMTERRGSIAGHHDLETRAGEGGGDQLADTRRVVHDQDPGPAGHRRRNTADPVADAVGLDDDDHPSGSEQGRTGDVRDTGQQRSDALHGDLTATEHLGSSQSDVAEAGGHDQYLVDGLGF